MIKGKIYVTKESEKTLTAFQYKKGMEDDICKKHNKPYISQVDGGKIYLSENDYIFVMNGERKIHALMAEIFEKYTIQA